MKKLLFILLACLPLFGMAKDKKDNSDPKYLAGAITMEDGKVTFNHEIKAPSLSKEQLYQQMLDWANHRFKSDGKLQSRVVYTNEEEGDIAASAEEYIVFSSSALSLDRTRIYYQYLINVTDGVCRMTMTRIRYWYDENRDGGEKYTAEEWITDKYCLNKDQTKLNRGNGKFRRKTVDFIDEMFASASAALGTQATANVVPATPVTPARTVTPAQTTQPATPVPAKEGYVAFAADKVPSTLLQMLPESDMQVVSAGKPDTKETSAQWKGTGNMFGKSIASIAISKDSPVYKEIGNNDTYSLSFFKKGESGDAWLIIDCRKQGETAEGQQITVIGEIVNVWMK